MGQVNHISLSGLQKIIKTRLEAAMPLPCWVAAEISELKVNYSGHCYIELVEKGGANQVPAAKASAVIWRSTYGPLSALFRSVTGRELEAGIKVLFKVNVSYHELYGLSLVVSDIDPLYTVGDMEQQRRETINRLREEGVWDMNRELGLPCVIQNIAVVSSRNAAGYQDFLNELSASPYRFEVTLFDAFMQGHGTEQSVIEALENICLQSEGFDAVILIRGGGAQSDLAVFDSYRLCSHIAQFPFPIVTGIGHDKDRSVADEVALMSLKTPTAVAGWLIEQAAVFEQRLLGCKQQVRKLTEGLLSHHRIRLQSEAATLSSVAFSLTSSIRQRLSRLEMAINLAQRETILRHSAALGSLLSSLKHSSKGVLDKNKTKLSAFSRLTESRSPQRILSLGFAVVRHAGRAVTDSAAIVRGDIIEVTFSTGSASARIEQTHRSK